MSKYKQEINYPPYTSHALLHDRRTYKNREALWDEYAKTIRYLLPPAMAEELLRSAAKTHMLHIKERLDAHDNRLRLAGLL